MCKTMKELNEELECARIQYTNLMATIQEIISYHHEILWKPACPELPAYPLWEKVLEEWEKSKAEKDPKNG